MADIVEPPRGTIVTLGGGGFSMSPDGKSLSLIDEHLLQMTGKSRPRVCFVGTASGDSMDYRNRFTHAFTDRAETMTLSLFDHPGRLDTALHGQDLVYVGGGSTLNLLALWRLHGLDRLLAEASRNGTILAGISAG